MGGARRLTDSGFFKAALVLGVGTLAAGVGLPTRSRPALEGGSSGRTPVSKSPAGSVVVQARPAPRLRKRPTSLSWRVFDASPSAALEETWTDIASEVADPSSTSVTTVQSQPGYVYVGPPNAPPPVVPTVALDPPQFQLALQQDAQIVFTFPANSPVTYTTSGPELVWTGDTYTDQNGNVTVTVEARAASPNPGGSWITATCNGSSTTVQGTCIELTGITLIPDYSSSNPYTLGQTVLAELNTIPVGQYPTVVSWYFNGNNGSALLTTSLSQPFAGFNGAGVSVWELTPSQTGFNLTASGGWTLYAGYQAGSLTLPVWRTFEANGPSPAPSFASLQVSPNPATVVSGASRTFSATAIDTNGNVMSGVPISWSATGGAIDASGVYTAGSAAGAFTVTASSGSVSASATVNVAPASLVVTPNPATVVGGGAQQFTATGLDVQGLPMQGLNVAWSATGGTIDQSGRFTAGDVEGSFSVVATASTVTGSAAVTVVPASVVVSPSPATVFAGARQTFTAGALDVNARLMTGSSFSWSATGGAIDTAGNYVAGETVGSFTVTVVDRGSTGTANVTVTPASIQLTPNPVNLAAAGTVSFTAVAFDANGSPLAGVPYVWNATGGSVDSSGQFTAGEAVGTFWVSATSFATSGLATINISPASVSVNPSSVSLTTGDLEPFSATALDANGTPMPAVAFVWSGTGGFVDSATGRFTAGASAGSFTVSATAGATTGTASGTISPVAFPMTATPEPQNNPATAASGVLLANGQTFLTRTDLSVPGRGEASYVLSRVYKSYVQYAGPLGTGWTHTYDMRLQRLSNGQIQWFTGTGRAEVFTPNGGGYTSTVGFFCVLLGTDSGFEIRQPDGLKLFFKAFDDALAPGMLSEIRDRHGNHLLFSYGTAGSAFGKLVQVRDCYDRTYTYAYDGQGRIATVTDNVGGRVITFTYSQSTNDLIEVTGPPVTKTTLGDPIIPENQFPNGKSEIYAYSTGNASIALNHKMVLVVAPNEAASVSSGQLEDLSVLTPLARIVNTWETRPSSSNYLRVVNQVVGGTNATGVAAGGKFVIDYGTALRVVSVFDRNGNLTDYTLNGAGQCTLARQYTNRHVRPTGSGPGQDPAYFDTAFGYNSDGLCSPNRNSCPRVPGNG